MEFRVLVRPDVLTVLIPIRDITLMLAHKPPKTTGPTGCSKKTCSASLWCSSGTYWGEKSVGGHAEATFAPKPLLMLILGQNQTVLLTGLIFSFILQKTI